MEEDSGSLFATVKSETKVVPIVWIFRVVFPKQKKKESFSSKQLMKNIFRAPSIKV